MKTISWCKKVKNGIRLSDPSEELAEEYYRNAQESLEVLRLISSTNSKMWIATVKYYTEYFAVYSLLMKIGVKCEIHDCVIALAGFLEKERIIEKGTQAILEDDKQLRLDNQYYVKNRDVSPDAEKIADFLLATKKSLNNLNSDRIEEIRGKLKKAE